MRTRQNDLGLNSTKGATWRYSGSGTVSNPQSGLQTFLFAESNLSSPSNIAHDLVYHYAHLHFFTRIWYNCDDCGLRFLNPASRSRCRMGHSRSFGCSDWDCDFRFVRRIKFISFSRSFTVCPSPAPRANTEVAARTVPSSTYGADTRIL